jgi:3-phenylpropionate/cinnamic acid dioxygenase small subunit
MTGDPAAGGADLATLHEIAAFLYHEAELLDAGQLGEWLTLLTPEAVYRMPVRVTGTHDASEFDGAAMHFDETRATLEMRVRRVTTGMAWAEQPPSRTRHFVSNIRIKAEDERGVAVNSNLLLFRNRGDSAEHDLISAERRDRLVRNAGGWLLADRLILVDQATLGTLNLAVFL